MAKARRKRKRYTSDQRSAILAAAHKDGLTAAAVRKRFGVTPVTYYSWRKKSGVGRRRGRPVVAIRGTARGVDLGSHVRAEVRTKVQQLLPEIVRGEVNHYLSSVFGARRRRRRHLS